MKILFSILLLSFHLTFAQGNYIAIITDPQVGVQSNAMNLIGVVEDINKQQNITQVVVLGNITANGKFDEFIWAQEILDELTAPYFVVGGEKDYFLSEGKGSEISLLWGNDRTFISNNDFSLVCLNTIVPEFPDLKLVDAETLSWLNDKISNRSIHRILIFSYYPINSIKNNFSFLNVLRDKKIYSITSKSDNPNNKILVSEGYYLNRNDGWGYSLIKINSDSLSIENISSGNVKDLKVFSAKFNPVQLNIGDDEKNRDPRVVWEKKFRKPVITKTVYSNRKIFQGFKNGLITSMDKSGDVIWEYQTNGRIYSSPIVENDLLIVATNEDDLLTINANTGELVQVIGIGEKITSDFNLIAIDENGIKRKAIIAGTVYGNLYCYDLFRLEPIWTTQISNEPITTSITYSNNKIFFQDKSGTLYCLSATNGLLIWKIEDFQGGWIGLTGKSDLFINDYNLFLIDASGNLFCIDALLGRLKWKVKNINANGLMRFNKKNELIIPTSKNTISIVSTKLGKVISEIELPVTTKDEAITDLLVIGDKIIVGFSDGWVYKVNVKQKSQKIFRSSSAPIVSLTDIDGNCLVTDYDGKISLIKLLH